MRMRTVTPQRRFCLLTGVLYLLFFFALAAFPVMAEDNVDANANTNTNANAEETIWPDTSHVGAVVLYHMASGHVVFAQNERQTIYPASTVKLMTGLLAVELLGDDPGRQITVTADMVRASSGFRMYLKEGEVVTVEQMLYAAMAGGYNDACVVLAVTAAGSVEAFVTMMNQRAVDIGAKETRYTNPTGLHEDGMVTTAYDTALIAMAVLENPQCREICGTGKYDMAATNLSTERVIYSRNALLTKHVTSQYYNSAVYGMNAGTTTEGGFCVVSAAEKQGENYLCVVMGGEVSPAGNDAWAYTTTNALYQYIFASYGTVDILHAGEILTEFPVALTEKGTQVGVYVSSGVQAYLPLSADSLEQVSCQFVPDEDALRAPLTAGDRVGTVVVSYGNAILGTEPLYAVDDVTPSGFLVAMERIAHYTSSRPFVLACGYAVLLVGFYLVAWPMICRRRSWEGVRYF